MKEPQNTGHDLPRPKKAYERTGLTQSIRSLDNTMYVFVANDRQLMQTLAVLRQPRAILIFNDHDQLRMFELEVIRALHNYLASALTLVDHTRALAKDLYEGTDFWDEYAGKKKEAFIDSSLAQFVQRLRNYMLHKALPFTSTTLRLQSGPLTDLDCFMCLNLTELRKWDGWSQKAQEYLDSQGDSVRLDELAAAYTSLVRGFHEWFGERQKELHY